MPNSKKLLIIGKVWPESVSSAAGSRMLQLIHSFLQAGWDITFACSAKKNEHSDNLSDIDIDLAEIKMNDSSFDVFIRELKPDAVLFDRFMTEEQFGWRVTEQWPDAIRVLDTEDLHCLRKARQVAVKQSRVFTNEDLFNEEAKREIASILRCDLSLIISEWEMQLLNDVFRIEESLIHYTPFMVSRDSITPEKWRGFGEREHFISIGNFLHEPNWDAVLQLKQNIWPLIRKELPKTELHICGAYSSRKVEQLHNPGEGFLIKGRAEDAKEVISRSKVMLAPLRFGAGLKGKLLDAMLTGTPSVTTTIGAEGMAGNYNWPGVICDDSIGFAKAAVSLYADDAKWNLAIENSTILLGKRFDEKAHQDALNQKIERIQTDIKSHRQKNFLGSVLLHHTMASTKYMSKWIEEKNKKPE